jgi:transposase
MRKISDLSSLRMRSSHNLFSTKVFRVSLALLVFDDACCVMPLVIRADYSQDYLLPPSLEDWVPADHPARFIRDLVGSLDLPSLGFADRESEEGHPSYAADLLLRVWLYGYMQRIRSSRRLEQACRDQMPLVWLTGNHTPDHNTLWRFFQQHRPALKQLFKQVVRVAFDAGLIGMALHAVDGTKVKARSSNRTGWHEQSLKHLLSRLDASIEAAVKDIESSEHVEDASYRMPAELVDAQHRRALIASTLAALAEQERAHYHPLEPEARMQQAGSERTFGYNAQAVVDDAHGLIVGATVVPDENDEHCLVPMLEEVQATVGSTATDTVADKGYATSQAFGELAEKGFEATVPVPKTFGGEVEGPYAASQFSYEATHDIMVCPQGQQLPFHQLRKRRSGLPVRVYRCRCAATCPVRWECSPSKDGRVVSINPHQRAIEKQRARYQDPTHHASYQRRKELIERVFAQIKEHEGFRRWTMRGLEKVQAQWSLLMTTYNLRVLFQLWKARTFVLPASTS